MLGRIKNENFLNFFVVLKCDLFIFKFYTIFLFGEIYKYSLIDIQKYLQNIEIFLLFFVSLKRF